MPKRYAVSPRRALKSAVFIATFYNSENIRITRSLGVEREDQAQTLCAGLVVLRNAGVRTLDQALALDAFVSPDCFPLFFGATRAADDEDVSVHPAIAEMLKELPLERMAIGLPAAVQQERVKNRHALNAARVQAGDFRQRWEQEQAARAIEQRSMLAQAAKAAANAPGLEVARLAFKQHLEATVQKPSSYTRILDRFLAYMAQKFPEVSNVAEVLPGHILGWMDEGTDWSKVSKKATRRRNLRTYLGAFFNWCAEKNQIMSPMSGVKTVPAKAVRRERGDIAWHSLEELAAMFDALPARLRAQQGLPRVDQVPAADVAYWAALIGTLAYAGLQLAELCWLRKQDFEVSKDGARAMLWVTTVADPADAKKQHELKTDNRRRHVDVHPRLLLPLLKAHAASERAGPYFLFRMPVKRKRAGFDDEAGRWREISLSQLLRGHEGGIDRKKTPGLLPAGMNAKSLRRTFGSLLIRSGKSTEKVAAAMGNTPEVVREHYARILGCEVDVDF